ncbi:MAG: DUF2922 domain-containing protein [Bacillota bacterium]|nr:DUF2922 domain-containing protein [Bacillota bacterium]MDW7682950.1 DUF2922 domain-containing protein [Bacillota bacterium]
METTLQLVFRNATGGLFTINLANPRDNLTELEVSGVMDQVLAKNIFQSTGGLLTGKVRARLVSREVVDFASYE